MAYTLDYSVITDAIKERQQKSGLTATEYENKFDELAERENGSTRESASLFVGLEFNTPTEEAITAKRYGRIASYRDREYAEVGCIKTDGTDVWIAQKRFQKPPRKIDDEGNYMMTEGHYDVYELEGSFFTVFNVGKTLKEGLLAVARWRSAMADKVTCVRVTNAKKVETAYDGKKKTEWAYTLDFVDARGKVVKPSQASLRGLI